jgi:hypothetical protein
MGPEEIAKGCEVGIAGSKYSTIQNNILMTTIPREKLRPSPSVI